MLKRKLLVTLSSCAILFAFTGCDMLNNMFHKNDPVETPIETTNPDGSKTTGTKIEYEDKTVTETKTVGKDYVTDTTKTEEIMEGDGGKMETVVTTESKQVFDDASEGDVKSIETKELSTQTDAGLVVSTDITTTKKDGSVVTEKTVKDGVDSEGVDTKITSLIDTKSPDGKFIKTEEIHSYEYLEEKWEKTEEGYELRGKKEYTVVDYDAEGKPASRVDTIYDNPSVDGSGALAFFNKSVTIDFKYINDEYVETKRVEVINQGTKKTITTVSNDDGTKSITYSFGENGSAGTGEGTVDKDGVTTIINDYENGFGERIIKNKDIVTREVASDRYYEKTVTEKGVIVSKECEYVYDDIEGIIFKTVTTYENGEVKAKGSNRYIDSEARTPAKYDTVYINVPNADDICDDHFDSVEISADGENDGPYTVFSTEKYVSGNKVKTDYPYDETIDMSESFFLAE